MSTSTEVGALDGADARRTDKKQPFADKVKKVEEILSKETQG